MPLPPFCDSEDIMMYANYQALHGTSRQLAELKGVAASIPNQVF